jgi:hypothetical protein
MDTLVALDAAVEALSDADRVRFAIYASGFVTERGMPGPPWSLPTDAERVAERVRERFVRTGDGTITDEEARGLWTDAVMEAVWYEGAEVVFGLAWALAAGDGPTLATLAPVRQRLATIWAEATSSGGVPDSSDLQEPKS